MNSFSSEISQRYALALYDLSKENNQTEEFVSNIKEFMKAFNSNESLRFFIKNPTYSVDDQKSVFNKILAQMEANKNLKLSEKIFLDQGIQHLAGLVPFGFVGVRWCSLMFADVR